MNSRVRLGLLFAFGFLGAMVAGRGLNSASLEGPAGAPELWRRVARSIRVGQAFDRGVLALRDGDEAAIIDAAGELRAAQNGWPAGQLATLRHAEALVKEAQALDIGAQNKPDAQAQQRANELYRQALQLSPQFESNDPTLLNALGYFLADRGQSADDFRRAEALTRRSLQLLASLRPDDTLRLALHNYETAIVRDSLAWALFRQNRLREAAVEQEKAIAQFKAAASAVQRVGQAPPMPADLPFHLGEIYRAQQRWDEARRQYQEALRLEADHAASREALRKLDAASRSSR